ncbi:MULTISPECIES: DUF2634 domain-containing protein [Bacillus]|uniref:DUF2634 domain-containing protein n=1 Tax=Bacillus TaxID=1386 RepID=UPI00037CFFD0|nr:MULTISPECIES: DUF2634 domain-containing protein [Bacillus]
MALTPENTSLIDEESVNAEDTIQPSKTWLIDFENKRIGSFIDNERAVRQYIQKALLTARNKFAVYTEDYGNELYDLIGADVTDAFLNAEIPRMVYEAIAYDDRIEDAKVTYERKNDKLFITVNVTLVSGGTLTEGVELNGV